MTAKARFIKNPARPNELIVMKNGKVAGMLECYSPTEWRAWNFDGFIDWFTSKKKAAAAL